MQVVMRVLGMIRVSLNIYLVHVIAVTFKESNTLTSPLETHWGSGMLESCRRLNLRFFEYYLQFLLLRWSSCTLLFFHSSYSHGSWIMKTNRSSSVTVAEEAAVYSKPFIFGHAVSLGRLIISWEHSSHGLYIYVSSYVCLFPQEI